MTSSNKTNSGPSLAPPAGTRFIIQSGSAAAVTNAAGSFSFEWPEAFPTAILSVQLTSGNNVSHDGVIAVQPNTSLTTCRANAVGHPNKAVRCDFIVIGY